MTDIRRFDDYEEMSRGASRYVADAAFAGAGERGSFHMALSGGSSPRRTYELLSAERNFPWEAAHFYFSDERFLPSSDERTNLYMVRETLAASGAVQAGNLHPVPVDDTANPEEAARRYEADIRTRLRAGQGGVPVFDLVMLGMGSDGHTASLFPGEPELEEGERLVVATKATGEPPVPRVTFTLPLIGAARRVMFLVSGAGKPPLVEEIIEKGARAPYPAAKVRPTGELVWFVSG
jgi:6-phosphogluconolactonase